MSNLKGTPKEESNNNNNKWTPLLIVAAIATTCGTSLSVGYNIGVVNSPAEIIKDFCSESIYNKYNIILSEKEINILWSAVVSIFLVGGATGSLGGSWFADKVGRKGAMIIGSIISIVAGIFFMITKLTNSVEILIAARLIVGISSGLATCVTPMYLTELAPINLRGAMGVMCPLGVTFGVLLGQVMSLTDVLGTKEHWHILLGFYIILVIASSIVFPFLPESPKYLYVVKKEYNAAVTELIRLRKRDEEQLFSEIRELKLEEEEEVTTDSEWTMWKVICDKTLLLPLLLVCSLQAGQQFSGINAVFYYSVSIFRSAGLNKTNSQYATIGAGCINFAMAVISIPVMSRFNRRSVIQISCFTAILFLVILGIAITYMDTINWMPYVSIVGVLGYVLCYGIGLGPIPYFIGSELFEVGPRPSAMALGSMANWGGNFFIGMTFPTLQAVIGASSFYIFAFITLLLLLFVRKYLPETRGRDVTDIGYLCRKGLASKPLEILRSNNV